MGGVVQYDCIIKIHSNVIEAGLYESYGGDKPGGDAGGALEHAEPFVASVRGEESSEGNSIRVDG